MQRILQGIALTAGLSLMLTGCTYKRMARTVPTAEALRAEVAADGEFDDKRVEGRNVTAEYREKFHHLEQYLTPELQQALPNYHVVFVHGLLGDVGLKISGFLDKFSKGQSILTYFKDQRLATNDLGMSWEFAQFRTKSVSKSADRIVECILAAPGPVILVSHSKGGIDTLDALLRLGKLGKLSKVAGWISLQSPFAGSFQADNFTTKTHLKIAGHVGIKALCGDFDAIKDSSTTVRSLYFSEHSEEIRAIVKAFPIVCFTSWRSGDPKHLHGDGVLARESGILPGTDYVAKAGVPHSATIIKTETEFDRITMTQALLLMIVDRIEARKTK